MSRLSLLFLFSVRLLFRARFTFFLLIAAVAFGLGFQIPNAANLNGYSKELLAQGMKRATGHVMITAKAGVIKDAEIVIGKLERLALVRHVAPRLLHAGFVLTAGGAEPVRVQFVDVAREAAATQLCDRIERGACPKAVEPAVILGWEVARQLNATVGSNVVLALPSRDGTRISRARFRVAGVLRGGGAFQEDKDVVLPMRARLRFESDESNLPDEATAILVFGEDSEHASNYRDVIARELPTLSVRSWQDTSGFVSHAIDGNRKLNWISRAMVTCAVLVPVLALLYIHVNAERRQIGALRAVGMTRSDILIIYFLKSFVIVIAGELLGLVVAFAICRYFAYYPIFSSGGFVVRPALSANVILSSMYTVGMATFLAGTWPAFRAALTSPAKELSST